MRIEFKGEKNYALAGYPLGHSMSPFIHGELFSICNTNAIYTLKEIERESFADVFKNDLKRLDGFNVTIPYKTDVIPMLDELSAKASLFGAVNTVDIKDGIAKGYNTDCSGFLQSLQLAGIELCGRVLVLGAGGVSRMFAFESAIAGAELTIAVRKSGMNKAIALQQEIREKLGKECDVAVLSELEGGYDLIINGTPAGMYPNVNDCPVSENIIKASGAAFDAVYNPKETLFIKYAKEAGLKYVNGLPMLVLQAAAAEEIWNGVKFAKADIERVIKLTEKELEKDE